MSTSFDLPEVEGFTVGTVGPAGQRVFYLQVTAQGHVVTLRCEKQQVSLLVDYLQRLLLTHNLPASEIVPPGELIEPVVAEWVIGSMMVAVNESSGKVILIAEELPDTDDEGDLDDDVDDDDDDEDLFVDPDAGEARIALSRGQVEAFVARAREVVEGGRPICPLCGRPINADGHFCPRLN